ncbi:DNA ligase [Cotia virus SPAn232]|uniref:DNA ligase n=2 Tax=Cotia virus TaxID=39444 RepID=H6TAB7_9POXV|nr:DNA ligase [Cotia virus SPAn232]AFB76951.1 DNA ligase [Cotia virus SPAn232]AIT70764.1 DNA ligase [Cotia virus]
MDCTYREFRKLCRNIANTPKYTDKTKIISDFLNDREQKTVCLIIKMLLPNLNNNVYNLNDRQIIKIFSEIFNHDKEEMIKDLECGFIESTIKTFFEKSNSSIVPIKKSILMLHDVHKLLNKLTTLTKYNDRYNFLKCVASICTGNDIKCFILHVKKDLRINAGNKCILNALNRDLYEQLNKSKNIDIVLYNYYNNINNDIIPFIPIIPMLANVCKSLDKIKNIDNGIFLELKYDGERVQIHKQNKKYKYFTRNSKDVTQHKIDGFDKLFDDAFKDADNFIMDSEIICIDTSNGNFLPFGSLGVHKNKTYENISICIFIFDCMYYNSVNIMNEKYTYRRKLLYNNINEIKNKIMLSYSCVVYNIDALSDEIQKLLNKGLEGAILKYPNDMYIPGKRKWIKIKRDYLNDGAMADSADLVVLGAYYGKGKRYGGIMSIFLMGCYDEDTNTWKTVTKCSGFNDETLKELQSIDMIKISKNKDKIPTWLNINSIHYPDFIVNNPKTSPVWEISGYEFTKSPSHTADGISIRFPRCKNIRNDKDWLSATNLQELITLYKKSKKKK